MTTDLVAAFERAPFRAYVYAYPHKTAYRTLAPPISLEEAWSTERREDLFLYFHVPFCNSRCGYCNLFSTTVLAPEKLDRFVASIRLQARRAARALGQRRSFSRFAVGGGTPSLLGAERMAGLLDVAEELLGAPISAVPTSVEMAPDSATPALVALLHRRGVSRVSIGVQALDAATLRALGRRQRVEETRQALDRLRDAGFPTVNIDLMYGAPEQDVPSWLRTVETTLEHVPDELYLYPLYVRPLTALGLKGRTWEDARIAAYRAGRLLLLERGFVQRSQRHFARPCREGSLLPYRCQEDGMVGLGPGARSYTSTLHYSSEYAVGSAANALVERYLAASDEAHDRIDHGFRLDEEEQRRRFLIKSLLHTDGLDLDRYAIRYGTPAHLDFPEIEALLAASLACRDAGTIRLTPRGLELSDAIGPWLASERVRNLTAEYVAC